MTFAGWMRLLALFTVIGVVVSPQHVLAQTPKWTKLTRTDFPTRVRGIIFANGNTLDVTSSVRYGQWSVQFGSQQPIAEGGECSAPLSGEGDGSCPGFSIKPLLCTNPVVGESPCRMDVAWFRKSRTSHCRIYIGEQGERWEVIKCPVDVRFE
jgi:hypothetical protein